MRRKWISERRAEVDPGDTMSATGRATWHDLSLADREALFYFGKGRT
jgi:hypothetical protein